MTSQFRPGHQARMPGLKKRLAEGRRRGVELGHYKKTPEHAQKIRAAQLMEKGNNWKGGRQEQRGYVIITVAEPHPRFGRRVPEHVLIVEKVLGRLLKYISQAHRDNETVHHINEIKKDNRNKNLLICTHGYHMSLHHRMRARC